MPGKPGVVCVEGPQSACEEFWSRLAITTFFVVVLSLHCYVRAFSPLTVSGHYSLVVVCGLLIVASLVAEHRL